MIISASYKTDIPAFYGRWFLERLRQGFAEGVNPWNGKSFFVDLRPDAVSGFVFWTRNIKPFERVLPLIAGCSIPFFIHYTVLGYPRTLDVSVIAPERSVAAMHRLANRWGPLSVVWRYDPVVFSSQTPASWHEESFGRLAEALRGATNEVVVSFMQIYRKTARTLAVAERAGLSWKDPPDEEKKALLSRLVPLAQENGMCLTLCAQPDLTINGIKEARCIDACRLSQISGRSLLVCQQPHRSTCGCWQSKDIGAYETCAHGCRYCYAVRSHARAKETCRAHDNRSPKLGTLLTKSGQMI